MYQKKAYCTMGLVLINVIVFFTLTMLGQTEDSGFMLAHGAMYAPYVLVQGEYYRIFTSMFLHFGFSHLMNNMIILLVLGWNLELELGKIKYICLYLVSGLGGTLLSLGIDIKTGEYAVSAGASGAIFGVIGALLYIALRNHGRVGNISGKGIIFMIVCSLYYGFTGTGIGNWAHIGGLCVGFLAGILLYWKRNGKYSPNL